MIMSNKMHFTHCGEMVGFPKSGHIYDMIKHVKIIFDQSYRT